MNEWEYIETRRLSMHFYRNSSDPLILSFVALTAQAALPKPHWLFNAPQLSGCVSETASLVRVGLQKITRNQRLDAQKERF